MTPEQWLQERLDNTRRIAATKTGNDRDGWIEDGRYLEALQFKIDSLHRSIAESEAKLSMDLITEKLIASGKLKFVKVHFAALNQEVQCLIDPAWESGFQVELHHTQAALVESEAKREELLRTTIPQSTYNEAREGWEKAEAMLKESEAKREELESHLKAHNLATGRIESRERALREALTRSRAAIVACLGGMGDGSAVWGKTQYDKGWTGGLTAALTAFDHQTQALKPAEEKE